MDRIGVGNVAQLVRIMMQLETARPPQQRSDN
jgi:hypothetical protein